MHTDVYIRIYPYIHADTYTYVYIPIYILIYTHVCIHVCILIYTSVYIHTYMLIPYGHVSIRMYISVCILVYIRMHISVCIYGQLKRSNRQYTFPKTFSFELRFWHNFVPDMPDSSEKLSFQGPPILGAPHCKCIAAGLAHTVHTYMYTYTS
jgi:hypothetical protein